MEYITWLFKLLPLLTAIGLIIQLEHWIRVVKPPNRHRLAILANYPIWLLVGASVLFPGLSFLISIYALSLTPVIYRLLKQARIAAFRANVKADLRDIIQEINSVRREIKAVVRRRQTLKRHGCPKGFLCWQMGEDGEDCVNFEQCKGWF